MLSINFTVVVLDEGTMFTFSSYICIANGYSSFNSHVPDTRILEASAPIFYRDIDDLADDLDKI